MDPVPRALFLTAAGCAALAAAWRENRGVTTAGLFPLAFVLFLVPLIWDAWEATN